MAQASKARSIYRQLLRELPLPSAPSANSISTRSRPSILSHPSPIKSRIRQSFTPPTSPTLGTTAQRPESYLESRLQEAEQFIQYLQAQRRYATLLERYNPGANMDEEERVRLTARKVGMDLPVEFDVKPWGTGGSGGDK